MRAAAIALLSLAALAIAALYAVTPAPVPERSNYELDLAQLRTLAAQHAGPPPQRLNLSVLAESAKPAAGILGGPRFDTHVFVWTAFQIVWTDRSILVDAPPKDAVQASLLAADTIIVTHEHPDHIGGIAQSPHLARIKDRLLLTSPQIGNSAALRAVAFPEDVLATLEPLAYEQHHVLAPGVVLVSAPGHTPGSQMVYVRLANDAELLLVGDVAWDRVQIEEPRGRPRISSWLMGEDHDAVAEQLRALHELRKESNLHMVVSHDRVQLAALVESGILGAGFETVQ